MSLLVRTGARHGDILLMTGSVAPDAAEPARAAAARGYRVSVLGLGTPAGAPYPTAEGTLGHARLESAALARLARAGNGHYAALTTDDSDLQAVGALKAGLDAQATLDGPRTGLAWQDQGYWLLPPLMLLAVFAFRRRSGVALALAACLALPLAPARAADLWRRPDQAAHARLERGNQAYRRGDYAQAAQDYAPLDGATAHYHRGNALAKAGQYQEAIDAYDQALRREPGMPDAVANKRAVEALLKRKSGAQGDNTGRQDQQGGSQSSKPSTGPSSRPGGPPPPAATANAKRDTPQPQTSPPPPAASKSPAPAPAKPADAQAQREADRAQRERMERALREAGRNGNQAQARAPKPAETPEQRERRLANEAWLRRIPDDPGGLLRTKFRLEHERRQAQGRAP